MERKVLLGMSSTDNPNYLPSRPALADSVKAVNGELHFLEPLLCDGTRTKLSTGTPIDQEGLQAAIWSYGNTSLIVVLNTSETNTKSCVLSLPSGLNGTLTTVFPRRPSGLVFNQVTHILTGQVKPRDVHVYFLEWHVY